MHSNYVYLKVFDMMASYCALKFKTSRELYMLDEVDYKNRKIKKL